MSPPIDRALARTIVLGGLLGLLFPLLATLLQLWASGSGFSASAAVDLHRSEPLFWFIDSAPFVLALFAAFVGRREANLSAVLGGGDRESALRTRAILDTSVAGIITIDSTGSIESFNPAAERMFAYTEAEVVGQNVRMLMPEPDRSRHDGYLRAFHETGEKKIIGIGRAVEGQRKDGTTFPMGLAVGEMQLGSRLAFVGIVHDRSEEARLAEEIDRFFRLSLDLLCIAGMDGFFKRLNPAFTEILGYSEEELMGAPFISFVHPDDVGATADEVALLADGAVTLSFENRYRRQDGSYRWFQWSAMPYAEEGVMYAIARDVTDLKERTQEVERARVEAEEANKAKSEFLANMSHEIRTPMSGVMGMTELMLDTELTEQQREYMHMASSSARALLDTINSILDFSKIEAGKFDLDSIDFSLRETMTAALKPLAWSIQAEDVEVLYDEGSDVPERLHGDPARLRQVLVNLAGNAVKFTPKGEVRVRVEKMESSDDRIELRFEVSDTGIGVPPDKLDHIFQAFHQSDGSVSRRFGGTGLGLPIASSIVRMMGGEIEVESELDEGSTFSFTAFFEPAKEAVPAYSDASALIGLRVLAVDDNTTNLRIVEGYLRRFGVEVDSVTSAKAALEALNERAVAGVPFDLVVLDVQMPVMDGFTLAQEIRRDPRFDDLILTVLTSAGSPGDGERCERLGIAAYLLKPVSPGELRDGLIKTLEAMPREGSLGGLVTQHAVRDSSRSFRILLAEDNRVNQELALHHLHRWGHSVVVANNGLEALEQLEAHAFDLVLMDIQMPEMDGLTATARIRSREAAEGGHMPIVAMTAHAMVGDRERCLEAGMDGYVTKPIDREQLRNAIGELGLHRRVEAPHASEGHVGGAPAGALDRAALMERVEHDVGLLRKLTEIFRSDRSRLLDAIEAAIEVGDPPELANSAHAIKGALRLFGAGLAGSLAEDLESSGRDGSTDGAKERLAQLRVAVADLEHGLDGVLAELEGGGEAAQDG